MAIKTVEELMESVRTRLGDDQSDEALALLEDISDTYGDMQSRTTGGEDWKKSTKPMMPNGVKNIVTDSSTKATITMTMMVTMVAVIPTNR